MFALFQLMRFFDVDVYDHRIYSKCFGIFSAIKLISNFYSESGREINKVVAMRVGIFVTFRLKKVSLLEKRQARIEKFNLKKRLTELRHIFHLELLEQRHISKRCERA